jgi:hypothetical protein
MALSTLHPYLGADVELFATKKTKLKYNVIGATSVISEPTGHTKSITNDGMLIEVNPLPQTCRDNTYSAFKRIITDLLALEKKKGFKIKLADIHDIPVSTFKKMTKSDKEMGCLPDINAYTGEVNEIPTEYEHIPTRTCGGHIHIGAPLIVMDFEKKLHQGPKTTGTGKYFFGKGVRDIKKGFREYDNHGYCKAIHEVVYKYKQRNIHDIPWNRWINIGLDELIILGMNYNPATSEKWNREDEKVKIKVKYRHDPHGVSKALINPLDTVKMLDLFVGIPAVLIEQGQTPRLRRRMYGKAGSFRYTPYGLEYRVLSNFWMAAPQLMSLFMGLSRFAINIMGGYLNNKKQRELFPSDTPFASAGKEAWKWLNVKNNVLKLRLAIDDNDFNLAKDIYNDIIEPIFTQYPFANGTDMPLSTVKHRIAFKNIAMNGGYIKYWNPDRLYENWNEYEVTGWNSWVEKRGLEDIDSTNTKWEKFKI